MSKLNGLIENVNFEIKQNEDLKSSVSVLALALWGAV